MSCFGQQQQHVWDRTIITFGITMKSLAGALTQDNWEETGEAVFEWSQKVTETFFDDLYERSAQHPDHDGDGDDGENEEYISDKQRKRFWAIAKNEGGFSDEAMKLFLTKHEITSTALIPRDCYERLCQEVGNPDVAKRYQKLLASIHHGNNGDHPKQTREKTGKKHAEATDAAPAATDEDSTPEERDEMPTPPDDEDIPF